MKEDTGYEPFVLPKKRGNRNVRIRRSRRRNQAANRSADPRAINMLTIEEENGSVDDPEDNIECLVGENVDLRAQLEDLVAIFEQYVKVATLKDKAERLSARRKSENDSPMRFGSVPVMNVDD